MKRLLRRIWWAFVKRAMLEKIGKIPAVGYPLILWIELGGGKEIYFDQGSRPFVDELQRRGDEIITRLQEAIMPDDQRPIERRENSITRNIARMRGYRREVEENHRVQQALIDEMEKNLITT